MNHKSIALLICIAATSSNWGMQQAHIKAAPSIATTIAQNPRYLFYTSAGCLIGARFLRQYLTVQYQKTDRRILNANPAEYFKSGTNKKINEEFLRQNKPSIILWVALVVTSGVTSGIGCGLLTKNKFFPATAQ